LPSAPASAPQPPIWPSLPNGLQARFARDTETHASLRHILSHAGLPADDVRVTEFLRFAIARRLDLRQIAVIVRDDRVLHALLLLPSPGRTALILSPSQTPEPLVPHAATLLRGLCRHLVAITDTNLVQALLEPADTNSSTAFIAAGFQHLARLVYLTREPAPSPTPTPPAGLQALAYTADTHALFRHALDLSFQQSLDCPRLNGLRSLDDTLEGHKHAGGAGFDPSLWTLLLDTTTHQPAGIALLARIWSGHALELVYLGISPQARRRGIGRWALRHTLAEAHRLGLANVNLAVDSTNTPALRLYFGAGFRRVQEREALMLIISDKTHSL
jgi:mycothiol synthase